MALSSVTEVEVKKEEGENEKEGENNGDQGGKEEKNGDKKEERKRRWNEMKWNMIFRGSAYNNDVGQN